MEEQQPWVCIHTNGVSIASGDSGADSPNVIIPTDQSVNQGGSFVNFQKLREHMCAVLKYSGYRRHDDIRVLMTTPCNSSSSDIKQLLELFFEQVEVTVTAVLLLNPWTTSLMGFGILTGLVVHTDATATVVAPVAQMQLETNAVIHTQINQFDLRHNPEATTVLMKVIIQAVKACPANVQDQVLSTIVLDGSFPDDFESVVETELLRQFGDDRAIEMMGYFDSNIDPNLGNWTGLSVIGCLDEGLLANPIVGQGSFGAIIHREQYTSEGGDVLFTPRTNGTLYAPHQPSINHFPSLIPHFAPNAFWENDFQWVCMDTSETRLCIGKCGEDDPCVQLPVPESCFENNHIVEQGHLVNAWKTGLRELGVTIPRGLVVNVPGMASQEEIIAMADSLFSDLQVPSVMFLNTWVAALMASGNDTGIVVHIGDECTYVIAAIGVAVQEKTLQMLPVGASHLAMEDDSAELIYKAIVKAIMASDPGSRFLLWSHVIVSGRYFVSDGFLDNMDQSVEELLTEAMSSDCNGLTLVEVVHDVVPESRMASWIGLSIVGSLAHSLKETPRIEGSALGVLMRLEDYAKYGSEFLFMPASGHIFANGYINRNKRPDSVEGGKLVMSPQRSLSKQMLKNLAESNNTSQRNLRMSSENLNGGMVCYAGWLTKQGGGKSGLMSRKTWKRRWFVLQGKQLSYHKTNVMMPNAPVNVCRDNALGTINMADVTVVDEWTEKQFGFAVHTAARVYYITADCERDRQAWIEHLERAQEDALTSLAFETEMRKNQISAKRENKTARRLSCPIASSSPILTKPRSNSNAPRLAPINQVVTAAYPNNSSAYNAKLSTLANAPPRASHSSVRRQRKHSML